MTTRRDFLLAAGGVSLGFTGIANALLRAAGTGGAVSPYGPLRADPAGLLDLPRGFGYRVLSRVGETMDDGLRVPGKADGMAAFDGGGGRTIIVRNHEVSERDAVNGAFGPGRALLPRIDASGLYDAGTDGEPSYGGTTTLVYDTGSGRLERQYLSLAGTNTNCAGGATPWGSWLTCEENVTRRGELGRARDHGYVFEVPARADGGLVEPKPLRALGRFMHEAVAVDPRTGMVYLTEDRGDGLVYRFTPDTPGDLAAGGRLEALAVEGRPSLDTRNWTDGPIAVGDELRVRWIALDEIEAPLDDLRQRGFEAGAARFARGEGIVWGDDEIFIVCTSGGRARKGQVWKLTPAVSEGGGGDRLALFVEPNDGDVLDMPDNAAVAPNGDLYLCEDGSGEQFVSGVTPEGAHFKFARNAANTSEFAGVCFSPDGSTMFVNIQHTGQTLAVFGPWRG